LTSKRRRAGSREKKKNNIPKRKKERKGKDMLSQEKFVFALRGKKVKEKT